LSILFILVELLGSCLTVYRHAFANVIIKLSTNSSIIRFMTNIRFIEISNLQKKFVYVLYQTIKPFAIVIF